MRCVEIARKTGETDIKLALNLDGKGASEIASGCGFLDHMLTLFAKHAGYDLKVACKGDVDVDYHHTTEDIGIALGQAFLKALGDKRGIVRYGDIILPMDETLVMAAVDISGRDYLSVCLDIPTQKVGDFDTELCEEFFSAFVRESKITLHIKQLAGKNAHHIIEGVFKAVARALSFATKINPDRADEVPSTKGVL
jgi:imidazoleglycerol-phosphate dehydratase